MEFFQLHGRGSGSGASASLLALHKEPEPVGAEPVQHALAFIKSRNQWEPEPVGSLGFRLSTKGRREFHWEFPEGWHSQGVEPATVEPAAYLALSKVCRGSYLSVPGTIKGWKS